MAYATSQELRIPVKLSQNKMSMSVVSNSYIMLWHQRLGHPSFSYMKVLYPNLFNNKEKIPFQCEHCVLSKQSRVNYLPHTYKPSRPFQLIHSHIGVHPEQ